MSLLKQKIKSLQLEVDRKNQEKATEEKEKMAKQSKSSKSPAHKENEEKKGATKCKSCSMATCHECQLCAYHCKDCGDCRCKNPACGSPCTCPLPAICFCVACEDHQCHDCQGCQFHTMWPVPFSCSFQDSCECQPLVPSIVSVTSYDSSTKQKVWKGVNLQGISGQSMTTTKP
jgi:hypothetical protein